MAFIQSIESITDHPNADLLELATVDGFQAVIKKGLFKEGEKVVYIEPDNCLPTDQEWAQPYLKYAVKRIKAIKIRDEWSEGLVIKLSEFDQAFLRRIQSELDEKYLSVFQMKARHAIKVMYLGLLKARFDEDLGEIKGIYETDHVPEIDLKSDLLAKCTFLFFEHRITSYLKCLNGDGDFSEISKRFDDLKNSEVPLDRAMLSVLGLDLEVLEKTGCDYFISGPGRSSINFLMDSFIYNWREKCQLLTNGFDMSNYLGVEHYEPPIVESGEGNVVSKLPYDIPKTDEPRWEKVSPRFIYGGGDKVDVTLKVDGQSCSFYYHLGDDKFGVLGRKTEFDPAVSNNYTAHVKRYDLEKKLREYCQKHQVSLCLRGESYGEGIQRLAHNPHCKSEKGIAIFSVWIIDSRSSDGKTVRENRYARKGDPFYFVNVARDLGLPTVDIVESDVELTPDLYRKYAIDLKKINGQVFEGVVIQHENKSCKIINKSYDSKK